MRASRGILLLVMGGWLVGGGCRPAASPPKTSKSAPRPSGSVPFKDVTERAGITFRHTNGSREKYLFLQTLGGGCAFLDYDGDGWQDILLVSCGDFPRPQPQQNIFLYRNNGDGTFQDVSRGSGLDRDCRYAQGVAVGDYDNDGRPDVFITAYGGCFLFHNETRNTRPVFRDVTQQAGVGDTDQGPRWASSAAFGDYNNDGWLDLYVCHYAVWSPQIDKLCPVPGRRLTLCNPTVYEADADRLYRNEGNGRFTDVTRRAGIHRVRGRGLALAWLDYNQDGWQDIYIANDMNPNILFRNNRDGTFTDVAVSAGVAYGADGMALSGMGVAVADYDNSGRESLFVTNLNGQLYSLFHNDGGWQFSYATETAGLRLPTLAYSGFGVAFLDFDRDGWRDLVAGNGHVNPEIDQYMPGVTYKEPKGLYHNQRDGTFRDLSPQSGDMTRRRSTRGLAVGDYDNDGKPDVLCVNRNDRAELFRNVNPDENNWLTVRLVGRMANWDGVGTKVWVTAGGLRQFAEARWNASYGSSHDPRLHFGLGKVRRVERLELKWLSGRRDIYTDLAPNQFIVCTEGQGYAVER